jgi:deazaflavin-dependent oxidoreductase (nitroreductase family)
VTNLTSRATRQTIMAEYDDFNTKIIREFRENGGRVGGPFEGAPLLILHTTGAKSGTVRESPVMYKDLGGSYAVFASKGGAPTHPAWYHNRPAARPDRRARRAGADLGPVEDREPRLRRVRDQDQPPDPGHHPGAG